MWLAGPARQAPQWIHDADGRISPSMISIFCDRSAGRGNPRSGGRGLEVGS